jgi:site-specific DNA-methyltransferase (adenine-specific)
MNDLICGDNIEILKGLDDNCIDLTVTSPPYDGLRDYNGYSFDFEGVAQQLLRVTKEGGVIVWVVGDAVVKGSETGTSFRQALHFKEIGLRLHDTMIFHKNSITLPNPNRYFQVFEYMFVLSKGKPKTYNIIKDRKNNTVGDNRPRHFRDKKTGLMVYRKDRNIVGEYGRRLNIWKYDVGGNKSSKDKISFQHPATFPEKLAVDHIISWSNEGDIVLDPFVGSGTTCKMSKQLNRNYIGIDISQEYIDIAKQRLNDSLQ